MNRRTVCVVATACLMVSGAAFAQEKYKDLLISAMKASSKGECPGELMSAVLQDQCEQQMPAMKPQFDRLGEVTGAIFKGVQQTPNGPAEVYRVTFENGNMTWMINTGPDGKIVVLWSPG